MTKNSLNRGILLLDKPEDLTSMQCVEIAKRILKAKKAGHSGTLDPKVTGLMLIAFNEATKAMPLFLGMDKTYEGVMRIHGEFTERSLAISAKKFTGEITQLPPKKSAVVRVPRQRRVYSFELLSISGRDVEFRTSCEAGTYIRKLCHDIGEDLGVGAHMALLRRTGIGPFNIEEAFVMDQVKSQLEETLFPMEEALKRMKIPNIKLTEKEILSLRQGIPVPSPKTTIKAQTFTITDKSGHIQALACLGEGKIKTKRVLNP